MTETADKPAQGFLAFLAGWIVAGMTFPPLDDDETDAASDEETARIQAERELELRVLTSAWM